MAKNDSLFITERREGAGWFYRKLVAAAPCHRWPVQVVLELYFTHKMALLGPELYEGPSVSDLAICFSIC